MTRFILILFLCFPVMAGTPRQNTVPKHRPMLSSPISFPQIGLAWLNNYSAEYPNETTVIYVSPVQSIPVNEWAVLYSGTAGTCTLPMTSPQEFFIAANYLSLSDVINHDLQVLSSTGTKFYTLSTLATDKNLWTYPLQISCVGVSEPMGFQSVLIAQNWVLANLHTGASAWDGSVQFVIYGTNGVAYSIPYAGSNYILGDMALCELVSNAPADCVPPWIFPCNYTNYFSGHTPVGLPCFWAHRNTGRMESLTMTDFDMPPDIDLETELCLPDINNQQGGTMGSAGDSGSPVFTSVENKLVLLYATTAAYPSGCGISDFLFVSFLTNTIPITQLKILDLNKYQTF